MIWVLCKINAEILNLEVIALGNRTLKTIIAWQGEPFVNGISVIIKHWKALDCFFHSEGTVRSWQTAIERRSSPGTTLLAPSVSKLWGKNYCLQVTHLCHHNCPNRIKHRATAKNFLKIQLLLTAFYKYLSEPMVTNAFDHYLLTPYGGVGCFSKDSNRINSVMIHCTSKEPLIQSP